MRVLALLLVTGCAAPECVTRCGVRYFSQAWSCGDLQHAEDKALRLFERVTDARFRTGCKRLEGWALYTAPTATWKSIAADGGTVDVAGEADCWRWTITVGNTYPAFSSLAHEYAHAIQACQPLGYPISPYESHTGWYDAGIYAALDRWELEP